MHYIHVVIAGQFYVGTCKVLYGWGMSGHVFIAGFKERAFNIMNTSTLKWLTPYSRSASLQHVGIYLTHAFIFIYHSSNIIMYIQYMCASSAYMTISDIKAADISGSIINTWHPFLHRSLRRRSHHTKMKLWSSAAVYLTAFFCRCTFITVTEANGIPITDCGKC